MIRSGIYTLGIIVLTGILVPAYAQPGTDTTWKRGGNIGINLSQVSLSQWAAGGDNAVGFNLQFNYFANYKKAKHLWNNRLELDYGLNKTKSDGTKKTNDKICAKTHGKHKNNRGYDNKFHDYTLQKTSVYFKIITIFYRSWHAFYFLATHYVQNTSLKNF